MKDRTAKPITRAPVRTGWALSAFLLVVASTDAGSLAASDPPKAPPEFLQAGELFDAGDFDGADRVLRQFIIKGEADSRTIGDAWRWRGSYLLRRPDNRNDKALSAFSASLELRSEGTIPRIWSLWQRCWVAAQMEFFSLARRDCDEADRMLRRAPPEGILRMDVIAVTMAQAELLWRTGFPLEAIETLQARLTPEELESDPTVLEQIGKIRASLGRPDEAIEQFEKAVALTGDDPRARAEYRTHIGKLSLMTGKPDQALANFRDALADNPQQQDALIYSCGLLAHRDQVEEAANLCREYLAELPTGQIHVETIADTLGRNASPTVQETFERTVFGDRGRK